MRSAPMFEEENTLPRSKLHFSIDNWRGLAGACQHHPDVRWHVVAAFGTVREVICVFRHEAVEELFQIAARGRIRILHDNNTATGVLYKHRYDPVSDDAPVDLRLQFVRDFVQSLSLGSDFELTVMDVHRWTLPDVILSFRPKCPAIAGLFH